METVTMLTSMAGTLVEPTDHLQTVSTGIRGLATTTGNKYLCNKMIANIALACSQFEENSDEDEATGERPDRRGVRQLHSHSTSR